MNLPIDLKYAATHEWARADGDIATVGITDHAQKELTDVVYVELPRVGQKVTAGGECAVVESVKAASDIYAPVSGEIMAANGDLASNPALVNIDPYGKGWFFKIKMSNPTELARLKTAEVYQQSIGAA